MTCDIIYINNKKQRSMLATPTSMLHFTIATIAASDTMPNDYIISHFTAPVQSMGVFFIPKF